MTTIIDGRKLSREILEHLKEEVAMLPFTPVFCDVLVGNDPASIQYVNMKKNTAEKLGIHFHAANFPADITAENLIAEIKKINQIPNMCGLIVQLPLPKNLDQQKILDAVDPMLDVDCLSTSVSEKFYAGDFTLGFPAALACLSLLDSVNLDLKDKKITVLGQGKLVGKPVTRLLQARGLDPKIITNQTPNFIEMLKEADIIISGIGNGNYIKGDMVKPGAVIIDAGTSELNAGIVGDVDMESVKNIAGFLSPVPGGVGPMTVAMLFSNILKVAKAK